MAIPHTNILLNSTFIFDWDSNFDVFIKKKPNVYISQYCAYFLLRLLKIPPLTLIPLFVPCKYHQSKNMSQDPNSNKSKAPEDGEEESSTTTLSNNTSSSSSRHAEGKYHSSKNFLTTIICSILWQNYHHE